MVNLLERSLLILQKPKTIVVAGKEKDKTAAAIYQVLRSRFKAGKSPNILNKEIVILESGSQGSDLALKRSKLPILVINGPEDGLEKLVETLPAHGYLILNSDERTIKKLKEKSKANDLSFGFDEKANFQAENVSINSGINFKLNYKGNIMPIWLENTKEEKQIYSAAAAAAVATVLNMNLVEISTALRPL